MDKKFDETDFTKLTEYKTHIKSEELSEYEKKELNNEKFAIVYDKEIEVWSEPNKISELKFLLHEGTKVKQIDTIQDWVNIQLENGTLGWIQSSSIKTLD